MSIHTYLHFRPPISRNITSGCFYLHNKLSRVSASHGGTLSSCQDAYCPDVESCRAKETAQDHSLNKKKSRKNKIKIKQGNYVSKRDFLNPDNSHANDLCRDPGVVWRFSSQKVFAIVPRLALSMTDCFCWCFVKMQHTAVLWNGSTDVPLRWVSTIFSLRFRFSSLFDEIVCHQELKIVPLELVFMCL